MPRPGCRSRPIRPWPFFRPSRLPPLPRLCRREAQDHWAGLAVGLLAPLEALRELTPEGSELADLAVDRLDALPQQPRHTTAFAGRAELLETDELPDIVQREAEGLGLAHDEQSAFVLTTVDPVESWGPLRLWQQPLALVEADGVSGYSAARGQLADLEPLSHSSHTENTPWT